MVSLPSSYKVTHFEGLMLDFFHWVVSTMQVGSEVLVKVDQNFSLKVSLTSLKKAHSFRVLILNLLQEIQFWCTLNLFQLNLTNPAKRYVIPSFAALCYLCQEKEHIHNQSLQERYNNAMISKEKGNVFFGRGRHSCTLKLAWDQYENGIRLLTRNHEILPKGEEKWNNLLSTLHSNLSLVLLMLGNLVSVCLFFFFLFFSLFLFFFYSFLFFFCFFSVLFGVFFFFFFSVTLLIMLGLWTLFSSSSI